MTLAIIVLLLYLNFRRFAEVAIIMGTLPMALIGGLWLLYWLDYDLSVAVGVASSRWPAWLWKSASSCWCT